MNSTRAIGRRTLLTAGAAVALVGAATASPPRARAAGIDYTGRAAFDVAEESYLAGSIPDNEGGGFAWGTSYYLLGLMRMYEAYHDETYLDRFEQEADRVLAATDEHRGVTDYKGRSGPVWRAAGNYTASHATLPGADGEPAIELRWAGVSPLAGGGGATPDALPDAVSSRSATVQAAPAESHAKVRATSGDTFDLTLTNDAAGVDPLTLTGLSMDPASSGYVVAAVNAAYDQNRRWTAKELREDPGPAPAPQATLTFEAQYYAFPVHTGMTIYPIAKYARTVLTSRSLRHRRRTGTAYLKAARRAVAFHDGEFELRADGIGDYVYPRSAPIAFDGLVAPYNMSHAMGQALAELYRMTCDDGFLRKIKGMVASLRSGLELSDDGAYTWTYWPPHSPAYQGYTAEDHLSEYMPSYLPYQNPEDVSHGAISVEFIHTVFDLGMDKSLARDLDRLAATYTQNIALDESTVAYNVDGTGDAAAAMASQCARWLKYAQQDRTIYTQALAVWNELDLALDQGQGSDALGVAYLNWAATSAWT